MVRDRKIKSFEGKRCGYELRSRQHLINHIRTHTGERPYKCAVLRCGMKFKREAALKSHVKAKHSSERSFACKFPACFNKAETSATLIQHKKVHKAKRSCACQNSGCSSHAQNKSNIKLHVKNAHNKAKTFVCSKCDYITVGIGYLKRHIRRHSARRDLKCSCPKCPEYFKTWSDVVLHFSNWEGESTVQCDHSGCGEVYTSTKALKEHKIFVHSKKSHACPNCNCSFSTNTASTLATHMIVHEGRNEKISCSKDQGGLVDSLGFACMLCDFVGYSLGAALDHAKSHQHPAFPCDKVDEIAVICFD